MTEKQIEKVRLSIKKNRAALSAEKRKYGGFDDSAGRRYYISDLYMKIADYKGVITYKKWFEKNFSDDIGSPFLSLSWSIAYFELGKISETKIHTINTAYKNLYLHDLLLDKEINNVDIYEPEYNMLEFTKSMMKVCKKISTRNYLDWLTVFIDTDEYKIPVSKFISLNLELKEEHNIEKRSELIKRISELEYEYKL